MLTFTQCNIKQKRIWLVRKCFEKTFKNHASICMHSWILYSNIPLRAICHKTWLVLSKLRMNIWQQLLIFTSLNILKARVYALRKRYITCRHYFVLVSDVYRHIHKKIIYSILYTLKKPCKYQVLYAWMQSLQMYMSRDLINS